MAIRNDSSGAAWDAWVSVWEASLGSGERGQLDEQIDWDPKAARAWAPRPVRESAARGIRTSHLRLSSGGE